MRVLLDTNVILDVALKREPFFAAATRIFEAADSDKVHLFITAPIATDIFYVLRKARGRDVALGFLRDLLQFVDVCQVDKSTLLEALASGLPDFEDAVQAGAAARSGMDAVVTRNKKDFAGSAIRVFDPDELAELGL